jgi:hypothetical protein
MIVTRTSIASPDNIEKENLAAHVEISIQRYNALEHRITAVENEIDHFIIENDSTRQAVIQTMVAGGTLLAVLIPAAMLLVDRLK